MPRRLNSKESRVYPPLVLSKFTPFKKKSNQSLSNIKCLFSQTLELACKSPFHLSILVWFFPGVRGRKKERKIQLGYRQTLIWQRALYHRHKISIFASPTFFSYYIENCFIKINYLPSFSNNWPFGQFFNRVAMLRRHFIQIETYRSSLHNHTWPE